MGRHRDGPDFETTEQNVVPFHDPGQHDEHPVTRGNTEGAEHRGDALGPFGDLAEGIAVGGQTVWLHRDECEPVRIGSGPPVDNVAGVVEVFGDIEPEVSTQLFIL